jgi:hypothetical protein
MCPLLPPAIISLAGTPPVSKMKVYPWNILFWFTNQI